MSERSEIIYFFCLPQQNDSKALLPHVNLKKDKVHAGVESAESRKGYFPACVNSRCVCGGGGDIGCIST